MTKKYEKDVDLRDKRQLHKIRPSYLAEAKHSNDIFLNNAQAMDLYITQRIAPNETAKDVVFKLPENIVPDFNIGISLGTKKVKEVFLETQITHIFTNRMSVKLLTIII